MKNPHDTSEYQKIEDEPAGESVTPNEKSEKKPRFSGAYYYVNVDDKKLAEMSFCRTTLTIIAFMLQMAAQLFNPAGAEYALNHAPSYAYFYVLFFIFGIIGVSIWLFVMNIVRYKFIKRIPVERAPRGGFGKRAYFGAELYMAVNSLMVVFNIVFMCMSFDWQGFGAMTVTLAATAAAVGAREVTNLTLRHSDLVPSESGIVNR